MTIYPPLAIWRREGLRLKQSDIAKILRTSQGHVSAVENGELPSPFEWERWSDAYGLTVKKFVALVRAAKTLNEDLPLFADLKPVEGIVVQIPQVGQIARQA